MWSTVFNKLQLKKTCCPLISSESVPCTLADLELPYARQAKSGQHMSAESSTTRTNPSCVWSWSMHIALSVPYRLFSNYLTVLVVPFNSVKQHLLLQSQLNVTCVAVQYSNEKPHRFGKQNYLLTWMSSITPPTRRRRRRKIIPLYNFSFFSVRYTLFEHFVRLSPSFRLLFLLSLVLLKGLPPCFTVTHLNDQPVVPVFKKGATSLFKDQAVASKSESKIRVFSPFPKIPDVTLTEAEEFLILAKARLIGTSGMYAQKHCGFHDFFKKNTDCWWQNCEYILVFSFYIASRLLNNTWKILIKVKA